MELPSKPMRILVCGGRDYDDWNTICLVLVQFTKRGGTLVHGDARGADRLAAYYWGQMGLPTEAHPADWAQYGRSAGPIRNQEMLDSGINVVIAFPGGQGTADMVARAKKIGVPVLPAVVTLSCDD